jgi:hypothetical protein
MNDQTNLLRQVHPHFIPDGELTSQAFLPFPKDEGRLSVYDGDQVNAEEAFQHYTSVLGNKSESVWGVTCSEVSSMGLASAPAPLGDFAAHAVIDFTLKPERQFRKLAKRLKSFASARGCLYPLR